MEHRSGMPQQRSAQLLDNINTAECHIFEQYRLKKQREAAILPKSNKNPGTNVSQKDVRLTGIARFKQVSKNIQTLITVCNQLIRYAAEKGKYHALESHSSLKLHSAVTGNYGDKKDLWFDLAEFRTNCEQIPIPKWAFKICRKMPDERNAEDVRMLCCLMRQLDVFQKYTREMLNLLAQAATTERFERGRVIVRKGHIGKSLYAIFNGSVAMLKDENEEAFLKEELDKHEEQSGRSHGNQTVLKRGDCFGKEALFRTTVRQATAVCLASTDFLVINLDDIRGLGFDQCLTQEVSERVEFFRTLRLFNKLPNDALQSLAEKSSTYQYLSDKIIARDTKESDLVFFCKKGQCEVLRKLSKSILHMRSISATRSRTLSDLDMPYLESKKNNFASNFQLTRASHVSTGKNRSQLLTSPTRSSMQMLNNCQNDTSDKQMARQTVPRPHTTYIGSNLSCHLNLDLRRTKVSKNEDGEAREKYSVSHKNNNHENILVRVATLFRGEIFGLKKPRIGDDTFAPHRSFILKSSGCEIVVLKRATLLQYLKGKTQEQLKACLKSYPDDDHLYTALREQLQWRCYRENLVSHLTDKNSNGSLILKVLPVHRLIMNEDDLSVDI
eukprot:gene3511-4012_t